MRILHLIPSFSGGGAERQLALLASKQAENGIDVAIIYHTGGPNFAFLQGSKVELFPLKIRNNYDPSALLHIIGIIRRWRPDIVQTWLPQMDILGGIAARLTGVPHILSERASGPAYGTDWKSRLRIFLGRRAEAIIANSQTGARYWQKLDINGSIEVIVNAITPYATSSEKMPEQMNRPAIVFAGRIAEQKNLRNLIAALGIALDFRLDAQAYILGTGHLETELGQWIASEPAGQRIHFIGYVDNLYPWYKYADVLVSVSDFEGHPNVVLEAASIGSPLVLSDIPEHREAIPAEGALFVDGHNPRHISDALLECLSNKDQCTERAMRSKQFVAGLSVESQTAKYIEIYRKLTD